MRFVSKFKKDLQKEFVGYTKKKMGKDLMAGVTVAAVALPLALAFGVSSGATAAAGLITAIVAGIVIGALSGASFQISGPTGAMAAILISLSFKHGMEGIFIACFFAGVLLLVAGILKLGKVTALIPSSVITGFTSGIAIIIALGQLDNFLGVKSEGTMVISKIGSYFTSGVAPNLQALAIGAAVILIMIVWPKKLNGILPSSLLALVVVVAASFFINFDVEVVGEIPKTLFLEERLTIETVPWGNLGDFILPAISIAALCMVEGLLCGASAGKMKNEKLDGDRELVAQGIGNMIIPFFGGIPATAAIARTSVVIKAGGQTRIAGITHAAVLLLSMFALSPIMSRIPLAALAGVLIVTAFRMNDWENIKYIFSHKFKSGMAKFIATMTATVLLDLTQAIVIGVVLSSVLMLVKMTNMDIEIKDIDPLKMKEMGIELPDTKKRIKIAYLTGNIFFAVVLKIEEELLIEKGTDVLILSMRGVPTIDLSGIQAINQLVLELQGRGTKVMISSIQEKVLDQLKRGGILEIISESDIFESGEIAIEAAYKNQDR